MKKFGYILLGVFIGFTVAMSGGEALAAVKNIWIGKTVSATMTPYVDDVQLEKPAVIIDGTGYLPIKLMSQATGLDYEVKGSNIYFTTEAGVTALEQPVITAEPDKRVFTVDELAGIKKRIEMDKYDLDYLQKEIQKDTALLKTDGITAELKAQIEARIEKYKTAIEDLKKRIAENEALIAGQ